MRLLAPPEAIVLRLRPAELRAASLDLVLGLGAVEPRAAQQVDRRRAHLDHDDAHRQVRRLLEHERRAGRGAQRGLADGGLVAALVERRLQAPHGVGELAHRLRHGRRHVVALRDRPHRAAAERLDARDGVVDLRHGARVAGELRARAAQPRREPQRLVPGGDGVAQLVGVDLGRARPGALRQLGIAALEGLGDLLERRGDLRRAASPPRCGPSGPGSRAARDVTTSPTRPPSSESRNRAPDRPVPGCWTVTTRSAETAVSETSTTLPPSATATTMAPATIAAICQVPEPITLTSASAIPTPSAIPTTISTA